MSRAISVYGAQVWDVGRAEVEFRVLHNVWGRVRSRAGWGALTVDLEGYAILPALVNAHDHLELNHFPRTKFRDRYDNAHQWGEDVGARLDEEPFRSLRAYPLKERCFIGALKNLLCGALTVAHHNPPHKCLFKPDFPVRVLRRYGWAHSLHFSSEDDIMRSYRATPRNVPWFIHLAEGTDEIAAGEYRRLKALGCIGKNTVIVHGVGMTDEDVTDAAPRVRGLVVCPTTNVYLLGRQRHLAVWQHLACDVAIGSDSRLTSDGDLLAEIWAARQAKDFDSDWIGHMAVQQAATILGTPDVGHLNWDAYADWIACKANTAVPQTRAEWSLVMRGGVPQIGNPDVMAKFSHIQTIPALLDGAPKRIHVALAKQIACCTLQEPGLELDMDFLRQHMKGM